MPSLEKLTQADISKYIGEGSAKQGRGYILQVRDPQRLDNLLSAKVQDASLYQVEAEVSSDAIASSCTCHWGGNCKHVAALLLKWLYAREDFKTINPTVAAPTKNGQRYPIEMIEQKAQPTTPQSEPPWWIKTPFEARLQIARDINEKILHELLMDDLRQIANNNKWTVKGTRKADLARQLTDYMLKPAELERAIKDLDGEHRRVLAAVGTVGHIHTTAYETIEKFAESIEPLRKHKKFVTYLDHLFEAGLIYYAGRVTNAVYHMGIDYGEWVLIPPVRMTVSPPLLQGIIQADNDLPSNLPSQGGTLQPADGERILRTVEQVLLLLEVTPPELAPPFPRPAMERFHKLLHGWDFDPYSILEAERNGTLKANSTSNLVVLPPQRSLTQESIKQLAPLVGDEAQLEFLYQLLLAAGFVQPGTPVTVRPQIRDEWFRLDDEHKRAILARTWFGLNSWNELWEVIRQEPKLRLRVTQVNSYGGVKRDEVLTTLLTAYRRLVLSALTHLPDDQWVAVEELFKFLKPGWKGFNYKFWHPAAYSYGFGTAQQANGYWHLANGDNALNGDKAADWQMAQGNFIRTILQGPLHWLGLVDLYRGDGAVTHFRLHGLGDLFFNRAETTPLPKVEQTTTSKAKRSTVLTRNAIKVHEDTVEVIPSQVNGKLHSLLERIAKRESARPDQFIYRLDIGIAHNSFEAGMAPSDFHAQWQEIAGQALPDSLATKLEQWWSAYGQVRIYREMTIIEFSDDHALTEMKALTSLNALKLVELSPRLVVIPNDAVTTLMNELQKAGYTPKQVN